jgi:hypothetical protein
MMAGPVPAQTSRNGGSMGRTERTPRHQRPRFLKTARSRMRLRVLALRILEFLLTLTRGRGIGLGGAPKLVRLS